MIWNGHKTHKSSNVILPTLYSRLQQSSHPNLKEYHIAYHAHIQKSLSCKEAITVPKEVTWIKTEDPNTQKMDIFQNSFICTKDLASHLVQTHSEHMYHNDEYDLVNYTQTLSVEHTQLQEHDVKEATVKDAECSKHLEEDSSNKSMSPKKESCKKPSRKNISCDICIKKFKRLHHLKKRRAVHIVENESLDCQKNAIIAVKDTEIKGNITDINDEDKFPRENEMYRCEMCSKNFKLKDSYKSHLRIHTGEKPFTCHICGKSFSHTGGLYYHLKHVHAGIKNHACDLCGRSFALKAAMEDHRRIHTGERPYICHTCGKSFKTKASLYIHSKIHTDSFPHPCTYCERRFRWRQQLLAHLTTHTGEKTHLCPICGKGFGVKNDLTRHKLIHSDSKPFVCPLCGLSFGQKRYLKNHEKSRHGIQR